MEMEPQEIEITCILCGSKNTVPGVRSFDYLTREKFAVSRCLACSIQMTLPPVAPERIGAYYNGLYYGRRKAFTERIFNQSHFKFLTKLCEKECRKILDVGCGNGSFVAYSHARGYDARGTEIAPADHIMPDVLPRICRKAFPACGFPDTCFDVVVMWHSLEHFLDPVSYLKEAYRVLKPDGLLMAEVPNIDSWQARISGGNWFHLDVPRHVFHFSPVSLEHYLEKTGFEVRVISHFSPIYGFFGFLQSFLNMISKRKNALFDFLNGKYSPSDAWAKWPETLLMLICLAPLVMISLPLAFLEACAGRGGVIRVAARKIA